MLVDARKLVFKGKYNGVYSVTLQRTLGAKEIFASFYSLIGQRIKGIVRVSKYLENSKGCY